MMVIDGANNPRDFETLPIIDKILNNKRIAPVTDRILSHKTLGRFVKKMLDREIVTYLIAGVLTTIVGYFAFVAFYMPLNTGAVVANIASSAIAILFAFVINKHFVFLSKDWSLKKTIKEFIPFSGGRVAISAGETGLLFLLVDRMGFNGAICKVFTLILVMVVYYILSKLIF